MSGIVGILRFDDEPVAAPLIDRMLEGIAHRGPDGLHAWVQDGVGLGQAMLHVTPESRLQELPLRVESQDLTLVMAGRLDNWLELRGRLLAEAGVRAGPSDADLVLAAYLHWGREFTRQLDGDFAIALWDGRSQSLHCVRDRLGIKPFFYVMNERFLAFASELHVLLDLPGVEAVPDVTYLAEMVSENYLSCERTPWTSVSQLLPAHRFDARAGRLSLETYWQPDYQTTLYYPCVEDYVEHYRELLLDTVRRMSRSHKPLAFEVSGGLDSSAVFACAAQLSERGAMAAPAMAGYTLDFRGQNDADELEYARAVADFVKCSINEVAPSEFELDWYLGRARAARDMWDMPNGTMSRGLQQMAAAQGSRVLFNGQGGDHWLRGSQSGFSAALLGGQLGEAARIWQELFRNWGLAWAFRDAFKELLQAVLPLRWERDLRQLRQPLTEKQLLSQQQRKQLVRARRAYRGNIPLALKALSSGRAWGWLHCPFQQLCLRACEQSAAEHGLEARSPYWSAAMVQFSISTPEHLRYNSERDRIIHRHAMVGLLPDKVLQRTDKAWFDVMLERQLPAVVERLPQYVDTLEQLGFQQPRLQELAATTHPTALEVRRWLLWDLVVLAAIYAAD